MAEIVGVVSSVIAFTGVAQKTISAIGDFRSATKERDDILRRLSNVEVNLKKLEAVLSKFDSNDLDLETIRQHLEDFKCTIQNLTDRLKPSENASGLSIRERLSWVVKGKGQTKEDSTKIEEFEQLLAKWLSLDTWDKVRKHAYDEERQKILDWLSPINFFARQNEIFSTRQPDTGTWLLESSEFQKWKAGEEKTLWCVGMPGAGKTVMASTVMDHLCKGFVKDIGFAIVYCNYKEQEVQTPTNLLSGVLRQLYDGISLSEKVTDLHSKHAERKTRPALAEVSELLQQEVTRFSKIFVIVDALDECPEENRSLLLEELRALQPKAHLMVTSRPEVTAIAGSVQLTITAHTEDLARYIDGKFSGSSRLDNLLRKEADRRRVKDTVIKKADGMFLLAQMHITTLATATSMKQLSRVLESLTENLDAAYEKTLERIDSQTSNDKVLAWRVLGWVSHALRPISTKELREALAIEPGATKVEDDALPDTEVIMTVCAGLITLDRTTDLVRLVHYTTQQYLERLKASRFTNMQMEIARTCLLYLSFTGLGDEGLYKSVKQHPLLVYASQYGLVHARGDPEVSLRAMILDILGQEKKRSLIQLTIGIHSGKLSLSPIHLSVYFGLNTVLSQILSDGEDINSNGPYGTAVTVASWRGFEPIAHLLLENGADIDVQGEYFGNSLQAASSKGYEEIVRLLFENGANVNTQGGAYGSALQAASSKGYKQIACLLLEKGANVNIKGGEYGNALVAASSEGHKEIVLLLLERGADVNAQGQYGNALQAASSKGYKEIVRVLLDNGADVNVPGGDYGNALQAASIKGHEDIVRLLLENGADVNKRGRYGNTLQVASGKGHEQIVRLLLEHGADVNAQGGYHGSALQAASYEGHEKIVQLLLENGADVNAHGRYRNSLQAALSKGHDGIVHLLLKNGTDVNAQGGHYGNALQMASIMGHEKIVRLLLENGADVNKQGGEYGNALYAASIRGREQIVRILLDNGADVNAQGGRHGSAVEAAWAGGHVEVAHLLLDHTKGTGAK